MSARDDAAVKAAYLRRITGYDVTEEKREYTVGEDGREELIKKTETVKHVPGDPRAAEFWLVNRLPKQWQKKPNPVDDEKSEEGGVVELPPIDSSGEDRPGEEESDG